MATPPPSTTVLPDLSLMETYAEGPDGGGPRYYVLAVVRDGAMFSHLDAYLEKASAGDAGGITPLPETRRQALAGSGAPLEAMVYTSDRSVLGMTAGFQPSQALIFRRHVPFSARAETNEESAVKLLYDQFSDYLSRFDGQSLNAPTEVTEDILLADGEALSDEDWQRLAGSLGLEAALEKNLPGQGNRALAALASLYGTLTQRCSALEAKKAESMAEAQKMPLKRRSLTYEARKEMRDSVLRDAVHLADYLALYADEERAMDDLVLFEEALIACGDLSGKQRASGAEIAEHLLSLWAVKEERMARYSAARPEEAELRRASSQELASALVGKASL